MNKKEFFICFFLSVFILLIIQSELLYNIYIPPVYINNNNLFLGNGLIKFGDLIYIFEILDCHKKGFNVYTNNVCVLNKGIEYGSFLYGPILLNLPLFSSYLISKIIFISSSILLFLYILTILKILKPNNVSDYILFLIAVLSPSSILLIERMNIDIIIFIFLTILIYKNKKILFDFIIIILTTFIKFYPIIFLIVFLIRRKLRIREFLNFFLCFSLILIFFIIIYEKLLAIIFILDNISKSFKFSFSLNSLQNILVYVLNVENKIIIKSILILINIFVSLILYNLFFKDRIFPKLSKLFLTKDFQLFFISALLSYFLYILFSNNYYREVYLIGTLPFLISLNKKKLILSKIIYILFYIKQIFLIVFLPIYIGLDIKLNLFAKVLVTAKATIDFIYITLLLSLIIFTLNFLFRLNK